MAPTIIRVKRKIDELQEIDSKIVLNCKKQKLNKNDKDIYSQFSFVGTTDEKQDVIPDSMLKVSKKDAENIIQRNKSAGLSSRLSENLEKSKEKRFKVVNFMRSAESSSDAGSNSAKQIILDVEKDEGCDVAETESVPNSEDKSSYVYDIYVAQDDFSTVLQPDLIDINDLSILDYNDYLYSCPRLTNDVSDDEHDDYDEDSNDENNWRNDYPDEDDFSDDSIDERAMRRAMQNFDIENDLSSDDEYSDEQDNDRNDFVYSIDAENEELDDDYDYNDANRYGKSYAKYKQRILRELDCPSDSSTDSSEE